MVPEITGEFIIIVNREKRGFAAVIASYLFRQGEYLPMFEFPFIDAKKPEGVATNSSIAQAMEFGVYIHNCLHKLNGCGRLILAGLTDEQKSYLDFIDQYHTIEIVDIEAVAAALGEFIPERTQTIECNSEQILVGLFLALQTNCRLSIVQGAEDIVTNEQDKAGIIIIENIDAVSSVIAINYAASIDADIKIVKALEEGEERKIRILIEQWRRSSSKYTLAEIQDFIHTRIQGIYFPQYTFATFFTEGIPYSLQIRNAIPCSYVHLIYRMDFFIFNNIFFENYRPTTSAIVFSTPEFVQHDETDIVIQALTAQEYYVRELTGANATAHNLDMHIRDFLFGLLHISSHGGKIRGTRVTRKFGGGDGQTHIFEYDEVTTFAPIPYKNEIPVTIKWFPRKLDGLVFGSKELGERNYSPYVYDLIKNLINKKDKNDIISEVVNDNIPDSCSIACADFDYQAGFDRVSSGYYSPYVFNNSCWSWSAISWEFLSSGVRGYIGTLFAIGTPEATAGAKEFYDNVFNEPLIESVWKANETVRGSKYEDIYIFFGLHFSTLKKGQSIQDSKNRVARNGIRSVNIWNERLENDLDELTGKRIKQLRDWGVDHLRVHLKEECESIIAEGKKRMIAKKSKDSDSE